MAEFFCFRGGRIRLKVKACKDFIKQHVLIELDFDFSDLVDCLLFDRWLLNIFIIIIEVKPERFSKTFKLLLTLLHSPECHWVKVCLSRRRWHPRVFIVIKVVVEDLLLNFCDVRFFSFFLSDLFFDI